MSLLSFLSLKETHLKKKKTVSSAEPLMGPVIFTGLPVDSLLNKYQNRAFLSRFNRMFYVVTSLPARAEEPGERHETDPATLS